jgi:hypothetical protein
MGLWPRWPESRPLGFARGGPSPLVLVFQTCDAMRLCCCLRVWKLFAKSSGIPAGVPHAGWLGLRWHGHGIRNIRAAGVYSSGCGVIAEAMHHYSSFGRACAS